MRTLRVVFVKPGVEVGLERFQRGIRLAREGQREEFFLGGAHILAMEQNLVFGANRAHKPGQTYLERISVFYYRL